MLYINIYYPLHFAKFSNFPHICSLKDFWRNAWERKKALVAAQKQRKRKV